MHHMHVPFNKYDKSQDNNRFYKPQEYSFTCLCMLSTIISPQINMQIYKKLSRVQKTKILDFTYRSKKTSLVLRLYHLMRYVEAKWPQLCFTTILGKCHQSHTFPQPKPPVHHIPQHSTFIWITTGKNHKYCCPRICHIFLTPLKDLNFRLRQIPPKVFLPISYLIMLKE